MRHARGIARLHVWLAAALLLATQVSAQALDRWHYIDRDSILYSPRADGLHGAGIVQSDRIFAMLYLGLAEDTGVVTVALPGEEEAEELVSSLVRSNGLRYERHVPAAEMEISRISDETIAYSFPISAEDIGLFRGALSWELTIGEETWSVSLDGSSRAIRLAQEAYAEALETIAERAEAEESDGADADPAGEAETGGAETESGSQPAEDAADAAPADTEPANAESDAGAEKTADDMAPDPDPKPEKAQPADATDVPADTDASAEEPTSAQPESEASDDEGNND